MSILRLLRPIIIAVFCLTLAAYPVLASSGGRAGYSNAMICAPVNTIHRVSLTGVGTQSLMSSLYPSLSSDGRYVAFRTFESLLPGDGDGVNDVYVYDRHTCSLQLISVSSAGVKGNAFSGVPKISNDGRYIAFQSDATNLVMGDTNVLTDVFLHDRQTGITTRVSVATGGTQSNTTSELTAISGDGRYIAFQSGATNLVTGDTNSRYDVFVHDRQTGTTTRVSVGSGGTQATGGDSFHPTLSTDGRYVAFESSANNLVGGDTNNLSDIFVHDRTTNTTTRVSVATGGAQALPSGSFRGMISGNGQFIAFESAATNLVTGDTNSRLDIFVHDRTTTTTTRVSVATGGIQSTGGDSYDAAISNDGRYVTFWSVATNLVLNDTNGVYDTFVHDRQTNTTTRPSVAADGTQGTGGESVNPVISGDGRYVAFHSAATNLVNGDTNAMWDVFVAPTSTTIGDTLALFNPTHRQVNLIDTLVDYPAVSDYTLFSGYAPSATPGQWVMGDWNGDGLDTPGVYISGVFYYTNVMGEAQASDWGGFWVGINGPSVAGRFNGGLANDCIGAVDSANIPPYGLAFVLYYTCDMSGSSPTPPISFQWLSVVLPDSQGFTGTFQFGAGDFNGDRVDSVAVRRGAFIAFGNVAPSVGPAAYDLAQYIGAPSTTDEGLFVVGDWDGSNVDSFGLFYQNGELFYRNDLDFNSGVYLNQSVGTPFGNAGVQIAAWH